MLTSGLSLHNQIVVNKRGDLTFRIVNMLKFLNAFAKPEKPAVSFIVSVRLSVRNNSVSSGWIFMKVFFSNGCLTRSSVYICDKIYSRILGMRNVSDKRCRGNQNSHFIFNNSRLPPPHPKCRAVYEIIRKNMAQPDKPRDENIVLRMRFACWININANTHSEYVIILLLNCNNVYTKAPHC